jgi:hypothetical protein
MNIGTKSLLFGVHQFLWHPWTVARAWRRLYGHWPSFNVWICILCHDLGYWGCPNMDGMEGRKHPECGARIAGKLVYWKCRLLGNSKSVALTFGLWCKAFTLTHSIHYAQLQNRPVSPLYSADKVSVLFDPSWFYLLRGKLSGEVYEYVENSPYRGFSPETWLCWYKRKTKAKFNV